MCLAALYIILSLYMSADCIFRSQQSFGWSTCIPRLTKTFVPCEYNSHKKSCREQSESGPPSHSLIKTNFSVIMGSKLRNPKSCLPFSFRYNLPN